MPGRGAACATSGLGSAAAASASAWAGVSVGGWAGGWAGVCAGGWAGGWAGVWADAWADVVAGGSRFGCRGGGVRCLGVRADVPEPARPREDDDGLALPEPRPVSYTHLTLPTILRV